MGKGELSAQQRERTWRFRVVTPFLGLVLYGGCSCLSIGSEVGFQWTVSRGCPEVLDCSINETEVAHVMVASA